MRMILILAAAVALTGCMGALPSDQEQIARGQLERRDAEQEALRRCPTGSVEARQKADAETKGCVLRQSVRRQQIERGRDVRPIPKEKC